jgi:hypothetical protein
MNERFFWKEGDITLSKCDIPITEKERVHAKQVIDEAIRQFKSRTK